MKAYSVIFLLFSFIFCSLISACNKASYNYLEKTKTKEEIIATTNKLEKAYNMCLGFFSNKEQAQNASSPLYKSQELISVPIWSKRNGEYWFYICWLQENRPEILLSQEVWNLKRKDREAIEVTMYDLPNKDNYIKDWRKKDPLDNLSPKDLILRNGCSATMKRVDNDTFVITGSPCRRDVSDVIKYIEMHLTLTPDSGTFHSKMMDINQNVIFSYDEGLQFKRQSKKSPKYLKDQKE